MSEIVQVQLPDGQEIWARVTTTDTEEPADISFSDRARAFVAENVTALIGAVAGNLRSALAQYEADEVSADFGIELSLETGRVIGVLAQTGATANVTVHMVWRPPSATAAADG